MAILPRQLRRWYDLMGLKGRGRRRRYLMFLAGDVALVMAALLAAHGIAFDGARMSGYGERIWLLVALAVAVKIPLFRWHHLYDISWNYVGIRELAIMIQAATLGSLGLAAGATAIIWLTDGVLDLPGAVLAVDYLLTLVLLGGFRFAKRLTREWFHARSSQSPRRVLVVGAGSAGEQVARRLREENRSGHRAVAFVDDDPAKQGTTLHGVPVLGARTDIPALAQRMRVDELWIAMPSCSGSVIRDTVELGRQAGLEQIKVVPGLGAMLSGQVRLADIRQVQLDDLLPREPVRIDTHLVAANLRDKLVLVTGAAGSIGSELCRQIARFSPAGLLLLDQDESGLFNIQTHLSFQYSQLRTYEVVGNVYDGAKMDRVFQTFRPDVVFHAAAYKHVPLMEMQPEDAIRTNIMGTRTVGQAAVKWAAEQFVLISTDKAVNPTSIMGATKRAAEVVIHDLNRARATRFVAVRFGNVLGSRGSVVPIFQEQIARGGPVTVTDPEMRRYFMTTEEAVMLVFQAAAIGEGGAVLVLDMGEPVKIVELARQLIRLSGFEPDQDIPIVFTGTRPGEKLFEDLLTAEEGTAATCHERVFAARISGVLQGQDLSRCLEQMEQALLENSREQMVSILQAIVPTYQPDTRWAALSGVPSGRESR